VDVERLARFLRPRLVRRRKLRSGGERGCGRDRAVRLGLRKGGEHGTRPPGEPERDGAPDPIHTVKQRVIDAFLYAVLFVILLVCDVRPDPLRRKKGRWWRP
jgi:hypothetical protein